MLKEPGHDVRGGFGTPLSGRDMPLPFSVRHKYRHSTNIPPVLVVYPGSPSVLLINGSILITVVARSQRAVRSYAVSKVGNIEAAMLYW